MMVTAKPAASRPFTTAPPCNRITVASLTTAVREPTPSWRRRAPAAPRMPGSTTIVYDRAPRLTGITMDVAPRRLPAAEAVLVGAVVVADLLEAVAAEFLQEGVGQHDGHHGLAHDPGRGDSTDVAALDHGLDRLLCRKVDGLERRAKRREWFHRSPDDDGLAIGDAALETAGVVRRAIEAVAGLEHDFVVHAGARPSRRLEAHPELAPLDGLDRAERLGQAAVEATIPLHIGAETDRAADGHRLEDAAQGVTLLLGAVDGRDDGLFRGRIGAADLGCLRTPLDLVPGNGQVADAHAADLGHVAEDRDSEFGEQATGDAGHRHSRGGLPGARTLQHVPDVAVPVLHGASEISMPWSRSGHLLTGDALVRSGHAHGALPVLPVPVGDGQRDGRAEGGAPAHSGDDVDAIPLDLHAAAAAVAALPPRQIRVDVRLGQWKAGGHAVDDGRQGLTVGFARGEEA